MADYPDYTTRDNSTRVNLPATVTPPAFDADASHAKTPQALAVEQQWRDVKTSGTDKQHPLSINRDSSYVTDDPYES